MRFPFLVVAIIQGASAVPGSVPAEESGAPAIHWAEQLWLDTFRPDQPDSAAPAVEADPLPPLAPSPRPAKDEEQEEGQAKAVDSDTAGDTGDGPGWLGGLWSGIFGPLTVADIEADADRRAREQAPYVPGPAVQGAGAELEEEADDSEKNEEKEEIQRKVARKPRHIKASRTAIRAAQLSRTFMRQRLNAAERAAQSNP